MRGPHVVPATIGQARVRLDDGQDRRKRFKCHEGVGMRKNLERRSVCQAKGWGRLYHVGYAGWVAYII